MNAQPSNRLSANRPLWMAVAVCIALTWPAGAQTAPPWSTQSYVYDGAGNIRSIGTEQFRYDGHGRLVSGTAGAGHQQQITYDAFGNITAINTDGTVRTFGVSTATNQLTDQTKNVFGTFDPAGRMTAANGGVGDQFSYDALDSVSRATVAGTTKVYLYSPSDERIASLTVAGPSSDTVTAGEWTLRDTSGRVLRRWAATGTTWSWKQDYIYRDGQLLAAEVDGQPGTLHFFPDHLGTPRLITANGGMKVALHTYQPFGEEATSPLQDTEKVKFTGHERDAASLDYMHARYYNPNWGRFLSVDPVLDLKKATRQPQNWNRYAYVMNNPINRIDPDGRDDGMVGLTVIQDCQLNDCRPNWEEDRKVASMGLSLMPLGIGDAYDTASAVTGRDYVGGERVGTFARIAGLLPFVSTGTVQRVIKAINLPGWKNVGIDMAHIVARHTAGGAQTSERASKFAGMSEKQIETAVRQAYRYGKQVGSQGDRVRVVGEYGEMRIEIWVNKKTKTIETAYPVQ